ncbi:MAG: START domain-containing protein [Myxococcales bacterium]|nr:START domain-containing protein [Myxococcales bacterium]
MRLFPALALVAVLLYTTASEAADRGKWRHIASEDGVTVSARDIPGQAFPEFRGVAVFHATMFEMLAILDDTPRHCQWQASCTVMRVLKRYDEFDRLLYHRIHAPWPASDRDLVFRANTRLSGKAQKATSRFRLVSGVVGPKSGIVRVKQMYGSFKFTVLGPKRIRVVYQVYSDPGGWLPTWLVRSASKKIPLNTLRLLRAQVKKTRGQYQAFHKRYDPAFGGRIPARFQPKSKATRAAPKPSASKG